MFSVPRREQLDEYSVKVAADRAIRGASLFLLSPIEPPWGSRHVSPSGHLWNHLPYRTLLEYLARAVPLIKKRDTHAADVLARYCVMATRVCQIIEAVSPIRDVAEPFAISRNYRQVLDHLRLLDGCSKLRADAVRTLLDEYLIREGLAGFIESESNLTNKNVLIGAAQRVEKDTDRVAWQLQGDQWRLAMVLPSMSGRTQEHHRLRVEYARQRMDWFDFGPVDAVFQPMSNNLVTPSDFRKYNPDFVYLYRKVSGIRIDQVLDLGIVYARRARSFEF
jgi:hypothetical protein